MSIKVLVSGALGRMGKTVCAAVDDASDMELVCGFDPFADDGATTGTGNVAIYKSLEEAIEAAEGKDKAHTRAANLSWRFYKMMSRRGEWAPEESYADEEKRFYHDCNELGVTKLREGVNIPWIES